MPDVMMMPRTGIEAGRLEASNQPKQMSVLEMRLEESSRNLEKLARLTLELGAIVDRIFGARPSEAGKAEPRPTPVGTMSRLKQQISDTSEVLVLLEGRISELGAL